MSSEQMRNRLPAITNCISKVVLYVSGQFYFTGTGSAIYDNYRKLSRKYEIKLTKL